MMQIPQISESELTLMKILWENGGSLLYADIMDRLLGKGFDWKKNTVLTFLSRLVDKKILSIAKTGRKNEYRALVSEDQYRADQTKTFVEKIYDGKVSGLVNLLVQGDLVSEEDIQTLRQFWERSQTHE